jgi:hypothetical protein
VGQAISAVPAFRVGGILHLRDNQRAKSPTGDDGYTESQAGAYRNPAAADNYAHRRRRQQWGGAPSA